MEKEKVAEELDEEDEIEEETLNLDKDKHVISTSILFPKDLLKQLSYIAVDEGVSRGEIIRRAVKDYLTNHNPKIKSEDYTKKAEDHAEKVKKLIELKNKLSEKVNVELEDEDFLPEGIDKAIAELEKTLKEYED